METQDRNEKAAREKAERDVAKAEKDAANAEKERAAAEEREKEHEAERVQRASTRALQKPLLDDALAAAEALVTRPTDGDASAGLEEAKQAVVEKAALLLQHETIAQASNETAVETVEQLASAVVSLRSTGFAELTKDALASAAANLKQYLEGFVVPEDEPPAAKKPRVKKSKKKASKAKKAAEK